MKFFKEKTVAVMIGLFSLIFLLLFSFPGQAKITDWNSTISGTAQETGIYNEPQKSTLLAFADYTGKVLLIAPFLGMILVIRVVWAGYLWMTARGNAEQVEDAKKTLKHAIIGVIIFVALYAVTYFILDRLTYITNYNKGGI